LKAGETIAAAGVHKIVAGQALRARRRRPRRGGGGLRREALQPVRVGLAHQPLIRYLIVALAIVGVMSYQKLGQSEDPPFTFKVMVVRADWPGASAREVEEQVTDRIEKKLQEVPHVDILRSYSRPGEAVVLFIAKDSTPPGRARGLLPGAQEDRRHQGQLPAGIRGPFFNDEFGDVFGNIYALTGDGFDYAQLKAAGDRCAPSCCGCPAWPRWT
jgi:multidrug efflux pump